MKTNEAAIFVFIASIIVGVLISMNLTFGKTNKIFLSPDEYLKAYNERNDLYKDLTGIREDYYKAYLKLQKYRANDESKYAILKEIEKELNDNNMAMGILPVEGEGIRITLNDSEAVGLWYYDDQDLIHDFDIYGIINDLRNAGAEAISINGQRIVFNSADWCSGSNIDLDGIKIVPPFLINAIGNKEVLKNYLILNETHYKSMKARRVRADLQVVDKIKIPGYTGYISPKYMNDIKK